MVWANADNPKQAAQARKFGAEGVGLCRTEHMFLGERAVYVQKMILASTDEERDAALATLGEIQTKDFTEIFKAMSGLTTIIRLIDPPLHEFLPDYDQILSQVVQLRTKKECGVAIDEKLLAEKETLLAKAAQMHESNPMIGTRGVRLCLVIPGLVICRSTPSSRVLPLLRKRAPSQCQKSWFHSPWILRNSTASNQSTTRSLLP